MEVNEWRRYLSDICNKVSLSSIKKNWFRSISYTDEQQSFVAVPYHQNQDVPF